MPPQSTVTPSSTAPATHALLPAELVLLDTLEEMELLALLDDTLDAALDLLEELEATLDLLDELLAVAVGPTEHHALSLKLLDGNSEVEQVKLPVSVA